MIKNLKKIWITGASSGIGMETALKFANNDWEVAASARRGNLLEELNKTNQKIESFPVDINQSDDVKKTFKKIIDKYGELDVCLFNSGIYFRSNDKRIDIETIRKTMETNYFGTINCVNAVVDYFKLRKSGHILIVGSIAGYRGLPSVSGYGASKAALINFTESLYQIMHKYNVKVSLINPGFIKTTMTDANDFTMPFLMKPDKAANIIYNEITKGKKFEITFPKIFVYMIKFLRILPYNIYFIIMLKKVLYKLYKKK